KITDSMRRTIDETDRRREKQTAYNKAHNITPRAIVKSTDSALDALAGIKPQEKGAYIENENTSLAADPVVQYMSKEQLEKAIKKTKQQMEKVVKELDFIEAARLRDEMFELQKLLEDKE
ncbi:MAG: excinuclease ABC subunit B, partial [Marinilabiliales bacterium]